MNMKSKLYRRIRRQISVPLILAMMVTTFPMNGFAVEPDEDVRIRGGYATSSDLGITEQDDSHAGEEATASDADQDQDLIDDMELATPNDAEKGLHLYTGQGYTQVESVFEYIFSKKVVVKGTPMEEVMKLFPEKIWVTVSNGEENPDTKDAELKVTWELEDGKTYDGDSEGVYEFYMQLPDGYSWAKGVSPYHLDIMVVEAERQEVCFWLDSEVDDFEHLIFEAGEVEDQSAPAIFVEKGIGEHGGKQRQYLKYELHRDVKYWYICQPYEYQWVGGEVLGGTTDVTINLTKFLSCTVQFEVRNDSGQAVTNAAITVTNIGDPLGSTSTSNISPANAEGTMFHVPVQSQSSAINDINSISYLIEVPGYAPVNGMYNLTKANQDQTITIPVLVSLHEKKTVAEVYDKDWDYSAEELEISTPEEMAAYSYWSNKEGHLLKGKKIVLTDDIDLSKIQWEPIGSNKDGEAIGDFDGQGHTVTIDMANVYHKEFYFGGLFGYIAEGTVKNLNVDGNINISGYAQNVMVGGIASAITKKGTLIQNCSSTVDIHSSNLQNGVYIGGIAGGNDGAQLERCSYDGDISMEEAYGANLGGIVGTVYGSAGMKRVTSSGSISVKGSFTCGGIAGFMVGNAPEIIGCSSDMEITAGGKGSVGGIIAGNTSGRISNAYFNGICMTQDGVLQSAYGLNLRHATFESCGYAEGSGHNDNGIAGVTCITAQMTQDEVLNALNTEGELPWFTYVDGSPVLIAPPEEAVVTRELGGVLYVQEGDEAVLSVSAVSPDNGSLSYKWQKDGEDITGIEAASYTIPAVTLSDGGDYSVSVVNQNQREETAGEVGGGSCRLIVVKRSGDQTSDDTGSWVGANGSTGFIKPDGSRCSSEWFMIDEKWYYFDQVGNMVTGWYFDPAYQAWFYLTSDGAMAVGWIMLPDGKWYYLNPVSDGKRGAMYADVWIDGYYLGKDGAWVESFT